MQGQQRTLTNANTMSEHATAKSTPVRKNVFGVHAFHEIIVTC